MVAGTIIANAGGYSGSNMPEQFRYSRTGTNATAPFFTAENCIGTCVLGSPIVTMANGGTAPLTNGTGTGNHQFTLLPGNSVKFPPYWIQMDASIAKTIEMGNRIRMEVRVEGFNLSNAGFERSSRNNRGTAVGRQSGIFEYASTINNGRIMRLSSTLRW